MDNKDILVNLKIIKTLGKQHTSGQLILMRIHKLIRLNPSNKQLKMVFDEELVNEGLTLRSNSIKSLGALLAVYACTPSDKGLINPTRTTMNNLIDNFSPFDEYVSYSLNHGRLVYSKVSLDQGLKVADDIIKEFNK